MYHRVFNEKRVQRQLSSIFDRLGKAKIRGVCGIWGWMFANREVYAQTIPKKTILLLVFVQFKQTFFLCFSSTSSVLIIHLHSIIHFDIIPPEQRYKMSIFMLEWISEGRRLIWSLSEEFLAEPTAGDRCRFRDFRSPEMCSESAPKTMVVEPSSSLIPPCRAVCRVGVTLSESEEWPSKSFKSHRFVKKPPAESRSSGLIRNIPFVRRSINLSESQSSAYATTRWHQTSPHSSNIAGEFLCCLRLCLGALGSPYFTWSSALCNVLRFWWGCWWGWWRGLAAFEPIRMQLHGLLV